VDDVGIRPFSARSLVLSVLLGLPGPRLAASAPTRLAALFGIAPGTMRTAISRMLAADELAVVEGGYELRGQRLIARKQAQDIGRRPAGDAWDGSWWVVTVLAPARTLAARRDFRAAMTNSRMGELRPDTWLRPANLARPPDVGNALVVHGALSGADPDDNVLVERLWDLAAMAERSAALLAELRSGTASLRSHGADALPSTTLLAAAVVRFLRAEPLLPRRLLPANWPVDALRERYADFDRAYGRVLGDALAAADQPPLPYGRVMISR
jgi:phenylacetic acid degradation operon negative regulatory protein